MTKTDNTIHVALAGNPNCGKTTIFNGLTGSRQHVGNYPGVTVEKRTGTYNYNGTQINVVDLPGTYSLTSYSPEELIAQQELVDNRPEVVVVVVDSTTLKRSMVLLAQIMQTGDKVILCLNMADEAKKSGQKIDVQMLETLLGFPVIETVGHKQIGLKALQQAIHTVTTNPSKKNRLVLGERLESALHTISVHLKTTEIHPDARDWYAIKLIQNDNLYIEKVIAMGECGKKAVQEATEQKQLLESLTEEDIGLYITQRYYGFVDGLLRETTIRGPHIDTRFLSDNIDSVVVNKVLGIPIFLGVMYSIFWLTFTVGEYPMGWIESLFQILGDWIVNVWPENTAMEMQSLIVDGIIGGVGGVVVFLPNIVLLFLGLAFLEDTGYMARAAFLTDRLMHRFGLHGRSFIPMVTGFGCTIPGIMATRTMENEKDRLTTMLVLPLMSCGARLPIWMLLIPAFFSENTRATMLFAIYFIGIILAFALSLLLRKTVLKGEEAPFVMELPPYRLPTLRSVSGRMIERSWLYLKKAGTIILAISILMWIMTTFPKLDDAEFHQQRSSESEQLEPDAQIAAAQLEHSIAGRIGKFIEPAIAPLGFDWKIGVATIGAFAAKEVFVSQLGIIYSLGETDEESDTLRETLARDYSPLVGFSLMVFLLIAAPCMATVAVTKRESGGWKWALFQFGGLTSIAYVLSLLIYQLGSLIL